MAKKIRESRIKTFAELHEVFSRYRKRNWIFRGHSDASWRLLPKIGRHAFVGVDEVGMFGAWKRRAVEFVESTPLDEWDWLAIAQHHGLATRLLDWTLNPLVAAFFAVYQQSEGEANIYAFYSEMYVARDKVSPLDFEGVGIFRPSAVARRISRQGGLFTVHGPPTEPLEGAIGKHQQLERVIIEPSYKQELVFALDHYGVNKVALFPDLDGLSEYVNWFMMHRSYWKDSLELGEEPYWELDGG
jgi:hypothetical protein